jgi:hypothetical protein
MRMQKTSISLPRSVWEAAKVRAMRERRTLAELVAEALAAYLKVRKS